MTKQEIDRVIEDIQKLLDEKQASTGIQLEVSEDACRQDDEWLYVVVSPAGKSVRAYDYVETLGEVEKQIQSQGLDHVLLVPAMSD